MRLYEALEINPDSKECICLVGAGGKTSAMFKLADELKRQNKRIIITTTTKIFYPEKHLYDEIVIDEKDDIIEKYIKSIRTSGNYIIAGKIADNNKLSGIEPHILDYIYKQDNIDYLISECDGSKRKPIKAPAEHEPVIPNSATIILGVIGLDIIGKTANIENVHRVEEFCAITGINEGESINFEHIVKLILHPMGLFKNAPYNARRYVLLNKADNKIIIEYGKAIKQLMSKYDGIKLIIGSLISETPIIQ